MVTTPTEAAPTTSGWRAGARWSGICSRSWRMAWPMTSTAMPPAAFGRCGSATPPSSSGSAVDSAPNDNRSRRQDRRARAPLFPVGFGHLGPRHASEARDERSGSGYRAPQRATRDRRPPRRLPGRARAPGGPRRQGGRRSRLRGGFSRPAARDRAAGRVRGPDRKQRSQEPVPPTRRGRLRRAKCARRQFPSRELGRGHRLLRSRDRASARAALGGSRVRRPAAPRGRLARDVARRARSRRRASSRPRGPRARTRAPRAAARPPVYSGEQATSTPHGEGETYARAFPPTTRRGCQAAAWRRPAAGRRLTAIAATLPGRAVGTVYAIANQKGGVGKTTTAVNLAACVAEADYESLLVDIAPQAKATIGLGLGRDASPTMYDVLVGEVTLEEAIVVTDIDHLWIAPSGPDLAGAAVELPRIVGSETRLRDTLEPVRERYVFTLLDCPPSLGPLTVGALAAADRVIVPVQSEYFALEGLAALLDTLSLIQRELNPRLTIAGVLLTMHDGRTRLAQDVEREVREHFPELVFDTVIPRNVRVGEAPSFGKPVIHHDPHSAGAEAYFELANELAARG